MGGSLHRRDGSGGSENKDSQDSNCSFLAKRKEKNKCLEKKGRDQNRVWVAGDNDGRRRFEKMGEKTRGTEP